MIHVALTDRIIAGLDVAVVGGEVTRRPPAMVGEIDIGAVIDQIGSEPIIAILRGDEQGAPAVAGDLVDVSTGSQQHLHRVQIIGADGIDQRRQSAAVLGSRPAPEAKGGHRGIVVLIKALIDAVRRSTGRSPAASSTAAAGDAACPLSPNPIVVTTKGAE